MEMIGFDKFFILPALIIFDTARSSTNSINNN